MLEQEWTTIPARTDRNLKEIMRRRCQEVVNGHGSHTRNRAKQFKQCEFLKNFEKKN